MNPTEKLPIDRRRELRFASQEEVYNDVRRLLEVGYDRTGEWGLARTCRHLRVVPDGAIDGFEAPGAIVKTVLFPLRPVMRRVALKPSLARGRFPDGIRAPRKLIPEPEGDDAAEAEAFIAATERFRHHKGPFQASPVFGRLGPVGWDELLRLHASHHLSHLIPRA